MTTEDTKSLQQQINLLAMITGTILGNLCINGCMDRRELELALGAFEHAMPAGAVIIDRLRVGLEKVLPPSEDQDPPPS